MADIQLTSAKINRKRPRIVPYKDIGIKESNGDDIVRTLTGSS